MKKDWNNLMSVVEILFSMGYTVSMNNYKRWEIFGNDNRLYHDLPKYEDEVRMNGSDLTNLDCLHLIITDFVDWSINNIPVYENWLTDEEMDFQEQIKLHINEK